LATILETARRVMRKALKRLWRRMGGMEMLRALMGG
jgi:hypothetical protein